MRVWTIALAALVSIGLAGCRQAPPGEQAGGGSPGVPPDQEPPVALNSDSPIQYPPRLYDQKVEGDVMLRLFVDSVGRLLPESSRVAESSGYPALDSAALTGARKLRFAPARRHGLSIATAFLQPVEFRHPQASGAVSKGEPDTSRPRPTPVRPPPAPAAAPVPAPVRPAPRDTTPARRDTFPRLLDTTRAVPDSAAKPDSNAGPH
jgi:TonB family protein